jgi:hypothetical protein
MEYKCSLCGHTSQTRCGHHELQAEIGTLIESNRLLRLQVGEMQKAIDGIYPYCKVKYGMPEDVVNAIERLEGRGAQNLKIVCTCSPAPCQVHAV